MCMRARNMADISEKKDVIWKDDRTFNMRGEAGFLFIFLENKCIEIF